MPLRPNQYKPYPGENPGDPFVGPGPDGGIMSIETHGRDKTVNAALWEFWRHINSEAMELSTKAPSITTATTKDLVRGAVESFNRSLVFIADRVVTLANETFRDTFGGPVEWSRENFPIRWPGENAHALQDILAMVSSGYQSAFVQSNRLDSGIRDNDATVMMLPLLHRKAEIMRRDFGIEVKGQISPSELDAIFRDSNVRPPLIDSHTDFEDTSEDLAEEDARALGHETVHRPTRTVIEQAQAGISVFKWVPDRSDWATFSEIQRRMESSGIDAGPGEPFPFAVGTVGGTPSSNGGSGGSSGGTTMTPSTS